LEDAIQVYSAPKVLWYQDLEG